MQNQPEEMQLSPEELAMRKEEMKKFYEDSVPYLELQAQYEKLLTEIEESRFKRASFQYQFAVMTENIRSTQESEQEDQTKAPRSSKLKKS
jgi:hypothetical protein